MKIENVNPEDRRLIRLCLMIIFFIALLKSAWLSDDAQITLRVVLNFVHGYGPVFNIGERVQAYTHPLWFFILSGITFFSSFIYCNIFALSIVVALVTQLWWVPRVIIIWTLVLYRIRYSRICLKSIHMYGALVILSAIFQRSISQVSYPIKTYCAILACIFSMIRFA